MNGNKVCPICGREVPIDTKICPHCKHKFSKAIQYARKTHHINAVNSKRNAEAQKEADIKHQNNVEKAETGSLKALHGFGAILYFFGRVLSFILRVITDIMGVFFDFLRALF